MAAVGEYVFSVAASALLCGIVCSIMNDCGAVKIVRLICSLVLMLAVLKPIGKWFRIGDLEISLPSFPEGGNIASQGELGTQSAVADIIKQKTEAYILDKANGLGFVVDSEVTLSGDWPQVPVSVKLSGTATPYQKLCLEEIIQEDLNIAKENQVWIG